MIRSVYSVYPLAALRRRAAAWLIDLAVGGVLAAAFGYLLGGGADVAALWRLVVFKSVDGQAGREMSGVLHLHATTLAAMAPLLRLFAFFLAVAVAGVAYRVATTAVWGAGLGKWLLGMRVIADRPPTGRAAYDLPGWGRAWRRWLVPQAPGLIPLPGAGLLAFLPACKDRRRRGLHDRAAGTVVIDVRRPGPLPVEAGYPTRTDAALDGTLAPSELTATTRTR